MNRNKPVIATCKICDIKFKTISSQIPNTCSDFCKKIYVNSYHRTRRKSMHGTISSIVAGCRNRAKRKQLDCDIDVKYITDLYERQNKVCAVTKVELQPSNASAKTRWNPNTITIDRIDSAKGYTRDNVQLVTIMYNNCKSNFTHQDVVDFCRGVMNDDKQN